VPPSFAPPFSGRPGFVWLDLLQELPFVRRLDLLQPLVFGFCTGIGVGVGLDQARGHRIKLDRGWRWRAHGVPPALSRPRQDDATPADVTCAVDIGIALHFVGIGSIRRLVRCHYLGARILGHDVPLLVGLFGRTRVVCDFYGRTHRMASGRALLRKHDGALAQVPATTARRGSREQLVLGQRILVDERFVVRNARRLQRRRIARGDLVVHRGLDFGRVERCAFLDNLSRGVAAGFRAQRRENHRTLAKVFAARTGRFVL